MNEEVKESELESKEVAKETIPQLFGRNVKKYRTLRKLTQEQLSEKLSISQKHLSIIETGTQFASAALIQRISEVLEVSPGDLFGGSSTDIKSELMKNNSVLMSMIVNELRRQNSMLSGSIKEIKNSLDRKNGIPRDPFGIDLPPIV